jgi:Secretion system C-terminal sorting domain
LISSEKVNNSSYRIIDMLGNMLADKTIGAISGRYTEKVDISEFTKGIYFIEIMQDGVKSTKKLIKY